VQVPVSAVTGPAGPAAAPDRSTTHSEPPPSTTPAAGDDLVVRRPATVSPSTPSTPSGNVGMAAAAGSSTAVAASTTVPGDGVLADCAASDVAVTVATEKEAYAPGGTVRGFSTLENRSASPCLLPTRSFFRIEDASGGDVSAFRYTADYRLPAKVQPGATVTDGFTWDQRNCGTGACVQVPSGTYMVFADWTEGGSYGGRTSFRIGS
jgi:hypothetical protein